MTEYNFLLNKLAQQPHHGTTIPLVELATTYMTVSQKLSRQVLDALLLLYPIGLESQRSLLFLPFSAIAQEGTSSGFQDATQSKTSPSPLLKSPTILEAVLESKFLETIPPEGLDSLNANQFVVSFKTNGLGALDLALAKCLDFSSHHQVNSGESPIDKARIVVRYGLSFIRGGSGGIGYEFKIGVLNRGVSRLATLNYSPWLNFDERSESFLSRGLDLKQARRFVTYDTTEPIAESIPLGIIPLCMLASARNQLYDRIYDSSDNNKNYTALLTKL